MSNTIRRHCPHNAEVSHILARGSQIFFSSSVADVALMARSLHESKQQKLCTRTQSPWNQQIDWSKTKKQQPHRKRRPANPPARLAFRQRKKRSKKQKNTKAQKRGQSPNENTHRIDLHLEAVENPLHACQKHANKRIMCRSCSGRHKDSARRLTLAWA